MVHSCHHVPLQAQRQQAQELQDAEGLAGVRRLVLEEHQVEAFRAASAWYVVGCRPDWQPEGSWKLYGFPWMIADVLKELRQAVGA